MRKKLISMILTGALTFGFIYSILPVKSYATNHQDNVMIKTEKVPLILKYDEEAPYGNENIDHWSDGGARDDDGWKKWSMLLGNGYFGVNAFGRTETERLQITEKTMFNPSWYKNLGGFNNFSETYIDFGHPFANVQNYMRTLNIGTAVSTVNYNYNGIDYSREYFTSYPDNALVIRLDASKSGGLSFTLRPTIPYEQDYAYKPGDGATKHGTVTSKVENGVGLIELSGEMGYYGIDFVGLYRVVTDGSGTVTAKTTTNKDGETDGTIRVEGAKSAYIIVTLGTDYVLCPEDFTATDENKPTKKTGYTEAFAKVDGYMNAIIQKTKNKSFEDSYALLKSTHIADHERMFDRVSLNINSVGDDLNLTTDELLTNYKNGIHSNYLEILYFQYGRYLLIASSRPGSLPPNLQGAWNRHNMPPWGCGYWHNINIQMNYWHAFSTNLNETFIPYIDYNKAYMDKAKMMATNEINKVNPEALGKDGGNGWCIGTGTFPYFISASSSAGNIGFTTQLFVELYEYTKDEKILEEIVYPVLLSAAKFITKCVKLDKDGHYLVAYCDSPEQHVNGEWYFTKGTTYEQSFSYMNNYNLLKYAKKIGIDFSNSEIMNRPENQILKTVIEQIDKYDPLIVGYSGQIKEFREEEYYGDIGEYEHRHISQLVGLYPGDMITSNTPAWLDASKYTLSQRGSYNAWATAHRINLWARVKDGEKSYDHVKHIIKTSTSPNLNNFMSDPKNPKWEKEFQVDGNFGGSAGIAEMLLQSHENCIAPLPAIPNSWSSGSYSGLCARGNFEVSAKWENSCAKTFNIKSNKGERCSVMYDGIANAQIVRASDNSIVNAEKNGKNFVSFDTKQGETYIIYGFQKVNKPTPVSNLNCQRYGIDPVKLTWDKDGENTLYNVYIAVESSPDYILLDTVKECNYTYKPSAKYANSRFTFAVTKLGANGVESERSLAYANPYYKVPEILGNESAITKDNRLQVTVNAKNTPDGYRVYGKLKSEPDSSYKLLSESNCPIIYVDKYETGYDYAISAFSKYNEQESKLVPITKILYAGETNGENKDSNLLKGISDVKLIGGYANNNFPVQNMFDEDLSTRFSTWKAGKNPNYTLEINLDKEFSLYTLSIYDFRDYSDKVGGKYATRSNETTIEVMQNGKWVTVVDKQPMTVKQKFTDFNLGGIVGNKIRISFNNTQTFDNGKTPVATIWEIKCTTGSTLADRQPIHEAYMNMPIIDTVRHTEYKAKLDALNAKIVKEGLSAAEVSKIANEIIEFTNSYKCGEDAKLEAFNLSLDGKIDINFRYSLTNGFLMKFPDAGVEYIMPNGTTGFIKFADMPIDNESRSIFTVAVSAPEMTDKVKFNVVYEEGINSGFEKYSVKDYAHMLMAIPNIEQEHKGATELIKSMLNYGAYAQKFFKYNTDNLASEGIYTLENDPVLNMTISENTTPQINKSTSDINIISNKLSLKSETVLTVYLELTGSKTADKYDVNLTRPSGLVEKINIIKDGERYKLVINNINARELSSNFVLSITTEGKEVLELKISAMCYVGEVLNNADIYHIDLNYLVKAFKLYSESADLYNFS